MSGAVTVTFRRWEKPHVKVGGRYRCHPIGVLEVDRVEQLKVRDIGDADAMKASASWSAPSSSRSWRRRGRGEAHRGVDSCSASTLHHGGDGDRVRAIALGDGHALRGRTSTRFARSSRRWTARIRGRRRPSASSTSIPASRPRSSRRRSGARPCRSRSTFGKLKKLGLTQELRGGLRDLAARPGLPDGTEAQLRTRRRSDEDPRSDGGRRLVSRRSSSSLHGRWPRAPARRRDVRFALLRRRALAAVMRR